MHNGLLENDDYYRNGVPGPKFDFAQIGQSIQEIFRQHAHVDPYKTAANDIQSLSDSVKEMLGSDHPVLRSLGKYFFDVQGKRVRPVIVCLVSRAMSLVTPGEPGAGAAPAALESPASPSALYSSFAAPLSPASGPVVKTDTLSPEQKKLSEITEMIHTASLLHDDVIDEAKTRRGIPSMNASFGNKLAILGGDFMLARASVALARLRNSTVTELLSTVIEHLVKGEIMQIKKSNVNFRLNNLEYYITKSFYKTASLIANSCKAVALLGGHDERTQDIAFEYGKNLGLAFQIVDDILDFTGEAAVTGKDKYADLQQGIATLPVYYAADEFPQLRDMIDRKFSKPGDVDAAIELIEQSDAIERSRELALTCAQNAVAAIIQLPPSVPRSACIRLVETVVTRKK